MGLVEEEKYLELMEILGDHRHGEIFTFIEGLLEEGYDLAEFYRGLVDQLRTLLRLRLTGSAEGLEVRPDLVERVEATALRFSPGDLVRMLQMSSELETTGSPSRALTPASVQRSPPTGTSPPPPPASITGLTAPLRFSVFVSVLLMAR